MLTSLSPKPQVSGKAADVLVNVVEATAGENLLLDCLRVMARARLWLV